MSLKKSKIKKILVISLTNIGDVILTFPVIDILREEIPSAKLSVVIGPKAESLFKNNPNLDKVYIFNKHQSSFKTISWIMQLRKEKFDLVIDLRNTAIPFLIASRYKTSFIVNKNQQEHMKQKHLNRLKSIYTFKKESPQKYALNISDKEKKFVCDLIEKEIGHDTPFVVMSPGAASHEKRWSEEGFAQVADDLINKSKVKVVFVGDMEDRKVSQRIAKMMENKSVNLCGRTDLLQLAEIFRHCRMAIVNDSAPMHLASYLNVPVMALFISTDPKKYGPWSNLSGYIQSDEIEEDEELSSKDRHEMRVNSIRSEDVLKSFRLTSEGVQFLKNEKI